MVAIKILRTKEEVEKIWSVFARGHRSTTRISSSPKISSYNSLSDARRIYTHEGLAQATWVSLERDNILHAKESFSLGRDVLKPMSHLGEQEYFELKKGSRLGEIGSI